MIDNKKQEERKKLHNSIWKIAEELRGSVDGWDFKQYVLVTLFYRFISENITKYINDNEREAGNTDFDYALISDQDAINSKETLIKEKGFFIKPSSLFINVVKNGQDNENLNEILNNIFKEIESSAIGTASEEDFKGLFSDMDTNNTRLGATVIERNKKLYSILKHISDLELGNYQDNTIDVFGDAYEFLMAMYASSAGKSGGEFFTPQEVSELLARLTLINFNDENKKDKTEIDKVYDPCCGSGSLLLKYAKILGKENIKESFSGQEINLTTYNLARINMFLHDINFDKFHIRLGDTLSNPLHIDEKPFDAIVSNPPYSIKWDGDSNPTLINDERFSVTTLAPKSKADLAFVLHMINHLSSDGTAAIVEFPGTLYRSGAEADIRRWMVENKNVVDTVIQLPSNLFFGTSISTCIFVLRKNKTDTNVFFIDASNEFLKETKTNKLTEENITKIVEAVKFKKEEEGFSRLVSLEEIKEKDFNLSVNVYVQKNNNEEVVDIKKLNLDIKETVLKINKLREEIDLIVA
ncbi:type I restriction-modification system subunit M [Mycoplasmopsis arginini]|uniref:type I restriction-modification system subunit M n=2 Tax=Mycoplasmopsis arginini TaxID=2094 RepID=UPI00249E1148|nr:type I restriction-modification system subunit M [Mycoplasmopsis arginini]MDI3348486.1 SAM-dependent DNA methyltransferase [Mycoplasmopsis arginini]